LTGEIGTEEGVARENERERGEVADVVSFLRRREQLMHEREAERADLDRTQTALGFIRDTIKAAGPAVTETLLQNISATAGDIFSEIMDDHAAELRWENDYEIVVQRGAESRRFAQLSGGEQMSAALAVRLALLKEMTDVNVAFFDEPTQNMDADRRGNLAGQIRQVHGFEQLIVISHDDTFEHDTDNLIRLRKVNDETVVEA
jgi:exonuclease SbcC